MDFNSLFKKMKQNPIALVVGGLLVLVCIYILILGVKTLFGSSAGDNKVQISKEEISNFKNANIPASEAKKKKRKAKRQKDIKEKEIMGAWDAQLNNARALLQIKDGTFRLIIVERDALNTRYYINGTYTLESDILIFHPNVRSKAPSEKYDYRILTRAKLPVMVRKYKGKMVWQVPPEEADIYVPNHHAILNRVSNKIAVWSALK